MAEEEAIIHGLLHGYPLCGFTTEAAWKWDRFKHRAVNVNPSVATKKDIRTITCKKCQQDLEKDARYGKGFFPDTS